MNSNFKVGDRVTYPSYVYTETKRTITFHEPVIRHGSVVKVYRGAPSCTGPGRTLYAVMWDDTETVSEGYMDGGLLQREAISVGGLGC